MSDPVAIQILPYSLIVGQEQLKLALELTYIAPTIGGVLISGQRGTGKSTVVRAFAWMMYQHLPVTLPINATEDRVIGSWDINKLMLGEAVEQKGLLEEAHEEGLLYVDEVNLLDDHIVNILLDVTSTGFLVIQREGRRDQKQVSFTLVGTMNPEEGGLRPQLLDRFGLMANATSELDPMQRRKILKNVLEFDEARFHLQQGKLLPFIDNARQEDNQQRSSLEVARQKFYNVEMTERIKQLCVELAISFQAEGHRGDYIMAFAARAYAALQDASQVTVEHLETIAPLVLQHRRPSTSQGGRALWDQGDKQRMQELLL